MKFAYMYPAVMCDVPDDLVEQDSVATITRAAETAGYAGIAFIDHPATPVPWRDDSGYDALDPFVGLAFAAANSKSLRLITHVLVLPYRNPFVVAKAVATLDRLSNGRVTLGVAAGYVSGEFAAVGADFGSRNIVFDESIEVMRKAWTGEEFDFEGRSFIAERTVARPTPRQHPHPPLWIGGNSTRSRERVARYGAGWLAVHATDAQSRRWRTQRLDSVSSLRSAIADIRERRRVLGRPPEFDVMIDLSLVDEPAQKAADLVDRIAELEAVGVTWLTLGERARSRVEALRTIERFGDDILPAFVTGGQ
jgi:probable F420-dependent oxidoreductase